MAVENSEMLAELNKLDEAKETSMVIISQELFGDEFSNLKEWLSNPPTLKPLDELQKNPKFEKNRQRAEELFEADADAIVPKIIAQDGKATYNDMMAYKMVRYNYYKEFPQNYSTEDKTTFLYFLTQNSKYDYDNPNKTSDNQINIDFMNVMQNIESDMQNKDLSQIKKPLLINQNDFVSADL